jgi:hypothetical protein
MNESLEVWLDADFLPERIQVGTLAQPPQELAWPMRAAIYRPILGPASITVGDIGANVGCVTAAADPQLCYAMLAQRDGESPLELMGRMDRAIATAAETSPAASTEIEPASARRLPLRRRTAAPRDARRARRA